MTGFPSKQSLINGVKKMKIHTTEKKQYINISARKQTKQAILDQLCKTIQMTSAGDDLEALRYDEKKEVVHADFLCHYDLRQINVACDSDWAMIKDVINGIHIG